MPCRRPHTVERLAQKIPHLGAVAPSNEYGLAFELFQVSKTSVMATMDNNLAFIREKIYEIRSAVMYTMNNTLVKIPNGIIHLLKIDEEGHLWFVCSQPSVRVEECEQQFPARLFFYKKGKYFHVEVSGKAVVMNTTYSGDADGNKPILIRMSMQNIEYTDMEARRPLTWIEQKLEACYRWVLKHIAVAREEKSVFDRFHSTQKA